MSEKENISIHKNLNAVSNIRGKVAVSTNKLKASNGRALNISGNSNSRERKKSSKKRLLAHDSVNRHPGFGLWCVSTEDNNPDREGDQGDNSLKRIIIDKKLLNNNVSVNNLQESQVMYTQGKKMIEEDLSENIDKKIIKVLKHKVENLTIQLQEIIVRKNEIEYEAKRSIDTCDKYRIEAQLRQEEVNKLKVTLANQDIAIKSFNEMLSLSKQEIIKYKDENEKLLEIIRIGKNKIAELEIDFNRKKELLNEENQTLLTQLQKMSTMLDEDSDTANDRSHIRSRMSAGLKKSSPSVKDDKLPLIVNETQDNMQSNINNIKISPTQMQSSSELPSIQRKSPAFMMPQSNKLDSIEFKLQLQIVDLKDKIEKLEAINQSQYHALKRKKEDVSIMKRQLTKYMDYVEETKAEARWKDVSISKRKVENDMLRNKLKLLKSNDKQILTTIM